MGFVIQHKFGRKVWIKKIVCQLWILLICLEKGSESGITFSYMLHDLLHSLLTVLIPSDILLARKVDLKLDDIWRSTMHEKMEEIPDAFTSRNIVSIQILFDFIVASSKLHGDAIMAFVHILENILHSLDYSNTLDVDVATILPDEIGTIKMPTQRLLTCFPQT